ncbi:MAG: UMP kinase [Bdellovibrionota bacterium]
MRYKRVLIKLSGGALAGEEEIGFDRLSVEHIVEELLSVANEGLQVGIVIGGGNIFRGNVSRNWGIERAEADNIGVLGTVINSLMLRGAIQARSKFEVRVMTAVRMETIAEPFIRLRAIHHLEKGYIVIFAGGIGQPYVTTDYPAVQRAIETRCDAILVAKHGVDGVYTADPKKDPNAKRYKSLAYDDIILEKLHIMDHSALLLARDYGMPVHIFNFDKKGTMKRICSGEDVGTFISPKTLMQTI